ncbi:hypothetical protein OEZ86_013479 [Tetradesmus obliquus]|nr:hypothetical protein OEZ86_013479 [Tetradesmus obliquus]
MGSVTTHFEDRQQHFGVMERPEKEPEVKAQEGQEHEAIPAGHHFAAPEVEEWKPHPYEGEGLHRRESLKGELPEERKE